MLRYKYLIQVAATVPLSDDSAIPSLTFRVFLIGTLLNIFNSCIAEFFFFRLNAISLNCINCLILALVNIIISYPIGTFFSRILPPITIGSTSLNPGKFTIKEHTLIVMIATPALKMTFVMILIITKRLFYYQDMVGYIPAIALFISTQGIAIGASGVIRRLLIYPSNMSYPETLVSSNLLTTFHGKESNAKITQSRKKYFGIFFLCVMIYQLLPSYFMTSLQAISFLCLFSGGMFYLSRISPPATPNVSFLSHFGTGFGGGGVSVLSLDWQSVGILKPLDTPFWALLNILLSNYLISWVRTF